MSRTIEILIRAKDEASQTLKKTGEETAGLDKRLGDLAAGVLKAATAFGALQLAQRAIEWAREGALVEAATARFTAFAGGAQEADRYLRELRQATNYTISDFEAMTSISKLLSMGLAENSAQAAELARMAIVLGDQTQSAGDRISDFSLMLANQSVMRLDNFGISSGRVRQRIEELMAATDGLTREQAFLQATLEQGRVALERVGGAAENSLSSWQRLDAAMKNNTNALKEMVSQGLTPAAEGLALLLSKQQRITDMFRDFNRDALNSGMTWQEYSRRVLLAAEASGDLERAKNQLRLELQREGRTWLEINTIMADNSRVAQELEERNIALGAAFTKIEYEAIQAGLAAVGQGYSDVGAKIPPVTQAVTENATAANEAERAYLNAASALAEMGVATFVKLQLDTLKESLDAGTLSQEQYTAATRALLVEFGLLTPEEERASAALDSLRELFQSGAINADTYAAAVRRIKDELAGLESKEITIGVNFNAPAFPSIEPGVPFTGPIPMAYGGDFMVTRPTLFLAGEAGPERATFVPQNAVGGGIGGDNARAGMTVNIYTQQSTGSIYRDLQLVEAML